MRRLNSARLATAALKVAVIVIILLVAPRAYSLISAIPYFSSIDDADHTQVAIILAAEVHPNGTPSAVLRDRILAGVALYDTGKVTTLVMSGRDPEPEIMRSNAVSQGVPADSILLDNYGLRTYDTCYRAANVFGLEEAIVVTQLFHLPRTLLLCRQMGVDVVGVPAQPTVFWPHQTLWWQTRETLATILAISDLYLHAPDVSLKPYGEE